MMKGIVMKVAVSAIENNLDSQVDPRFGRATYFLIVDSDSLDFESIKNPNINALGGAGVQSAQLVINNGAKSVLTGKCGPKAFHVFEAAGIKIYEDVEGTAREAVTALHKNQMLPSKMPGGKPEKPLGKEGKA
jgi:predicted Fe-Mo cluster-binding NifX family protein